MDARAQGRTSCSAPRRAASWLGAAIAVEVGCGFVAARRPGKLPPETVSATYALEYGENSAGGRSRRDRDAAPASSSTTTCSRPAAPWRRSPASSSSSAARSSGVNFVIELCVPRRPRAAVETRTTCLLADPVLTSDRSPSGRLSSRTCACTTRSRAATRSPVPARGEAQVLLSAFRTHRAAAGRGAPGRLPRRASTAAAASEHDGLVTHDELDWAPLGLGAGEFLNLMTARLDPVAPSSASSPPRTSERGEWPWSFFCYPEERPRPVFPSLVHAARAGHRTAAVGLAVRCPGCRRLSLNLVSHAHVDVPFHNDAQIGVVEHVFRTTPSGRSRSSRTSCTLRDSTPGACRCSRGCGFGGRGRTGPEVVACTV